MKRMNATLLALLASVGMAHAEDTLSTNPNARTAQRGSAGVLAAGDISQMTNNAPEDGNGVACGVFGEHTSENSWYRRFYFSEHPQVGASTRINSVTVASDMGPVIPTTINVYTIPHSIPVDTLERSAMVLIGSGTGTVGGRLTTSTIAIPSRPVISDTTANDLVVEYFITGAPYPFYPGGNPDPQTHYTFMRAPTCGWVEPIRNIDLPLGQEVFHVVMVVNTGSATPGPAAVLPSFTPDHVAAGATSQLTLTLDNVNQTTDAVLSSSLEDSLPAGLVLATPSNAATTCADGVVTATGGASSVSLGAGASIPAGGTCTVKVDVNAAASGSYVNTIAAGALVTQFGLSASATSATLTVGFDFPAPYCPVVFNEGVDPISRVLGMGIDHSSDPALDASPALENFTPVVGEVSPGESYTIAAEGNTAGDYTEAVKVYVDWNQDGIFDVATEGTMLGYLVNSTGTDGQQVTATIQVPASAKAGPTRMRVIKKFGVTADPWPCNEGDSGWGQAEDYTIIVGAGDGIFCSGFEDGETGACGAPPSSPNIVLGGRSTASPRAASMPLR